MKFSLILLVSPLILTHCTLFAGAASSQSSLLSLSDIQNARAKRAIGTPFDIKCVVISYHDLDGPILVTDGTNTLNIRNDSLVSSETLQNGDLVRFTGQIARLNPHGTYHTFVNCTNIEILAHGNLPTPKPVSAKDIRSGTLKPDELIQTVGKIVDVSVDDTHANWATAILEDCGEKFYMALERRPGETFMLDRLIGARVSAIGIYARMSEGVHKTINGCISVNSMRMLKVLSPPPRDTDSITHKDVSGYDFSVRENILPTEKRSAVGTVLAVWNRHNLLLSTAPERFVRCELSQTELPHPGDRIRVVGYPETDLFTPILIRAFWHPETTETPVPPQEGNDILIRDLQTNDYGNRQFNFHFYGQSVRLRGIVRGVPIKDGDGLLYVESDGQMVTVDVSEVPNATDGLGIGFEVEVTGICVMDTEKMTFNCVFPRVHGYRIVIRTPDDIRVMSRPSYWTPTRLMAIIGILLVTLIVIFIWNRILQHIITRRSRELFHEQIEHYGATLRVDERTRLAVELHDSLSQTLTGVAMEVETAEQFSADAQPQVRQHLALAHRALKSCRDELRNCLWDLRNQSLEEPDMNAAIRQAILPHIKNVKTSIRFNIPRSRFSDKTVHTLLRIIRELTVNAIHHGKATTIQIAGGLEGDTLKFSVTNNGNPFDPDSVPGIPQGHFGIEGIRERIEKFSGTLSYSYTSNHGVRAKVTMKVLRPDHGLRHADDKDKGQV